MVFGYYHITLRTAERGIIPEVDNIPGARIVEKVKVGHMLWIPFFPLGRVWLIENQGNMYGLAPQAAALLNAKQGKSSNPWYSWLGLIAIPVLFCLFSINQFFADKARTKRNKEYFEQKLADRMDKIDQPNTSDIFFFKDRQYKKVGLKVNYANTDSIYFLAPLDNENKNWGRKNWAAGYFSSDNPTKEVAFAKSDLKKTFQTNQNENFYKKGIMAPEIPLNGLIQLDRIERIAEGDKIPVISEVETEKIKLAFTHFIEHSTNLDSLLVLIDQESHTFYNNILDQAAKKDTEIVNMIKNERKINNCLYELMLYTKYVYLHSTNKSKDKSTGTALKKDYMFFLKLLERGLLTLENERLKNILLNTVTIPEKGIAKLSLRAPSNMLVTKQKINFQVTMKKEDGRWKMNLPSAYSYSERQITGSIMMRSSTTSKQWREMVRNSVTEAASEDAFIGNAFMY